jgi:tetratricopeptide (TPR) repeat protein
VRAYYDAHRADYLQPATVTLSHILLKTEADARRVKGFAKAGQDWAKLVTRFTTDSLSRVGGGALGTVTREGAFGSLGAQPALAESAFALGSHAIGGPYKTARGWHVIKVDTVRAETTRPFEQMRARIAQQLGQTRAQDFYKKRLAEEKAALGFTEDSTAINAFVSQKESAQELFRRAQEAGPPQARLDAYRQVVQEYPDSNVSPQAQFMVGFINSEELKNYTEAETAFRELLSRYPKSELAESARWMIDHMRTEEAPTFMNLEADSSAHAAPAAGAKRRSGKP